MGVRTFTVFDVVESGLEAMAELVTIYQVNVECRNIVGYESRRPRRFAKRGLIKGTPKGERRQ